MVTFLLHKHFLVLPHVIYSYVADETPEVWLYINLSQATLNTPSNGIAIHSSEHAVCWEMAGLAMLEVRGGAVRNGRNY